MNAKVIKVKVSAGAKVEKIEEVSPDVFKIRVQEPPERGRANARVTRLLANYFNVPPAYVLLKGGASNREKTFLIDFP